MIKAAPSAPPVLTIMGIARDSIDGVLGAREQASAILEEHERRMEPFKDIELSDQEVAKEILTSLPPEKASALLSALTDAEKLAHSFPAEAAVKRPVGTGELAAGLQKIRDNLHKALGGGATSLDLLPQTALAAAPVVKLLAVQFAVAVPVNPPEIVSIEGEEFQIDMNSMEPLRPCVMELLDSRYMIWKNEDGALVMTEA